MLRKAGIACALMLSLPTFASAWTVTAKIGSGAGSITDGTTALSKLASEPAKIAYYKVADAVYATDGTKLSDAVASQTITVSAPDTAYVVSSVVVDGLVKGTGTGPYTINYAGKNHTMVVYYTAVTSTLSVSQNAGGTVYVQRYDDATGKTYGPISRSGFTGMKAGIKVKVTAIPNADYSVASVNGTNVTGAQGAPKTAIITIAAGANSAAATFGLVPTAYAHLSAGTAVTSLNGYSSYVPAATYLTGTTVPLIPTATGNQGVTPSYDVYAASDLTTKLTSGFTFAADNSTVSFAAPGKYVVALTATSNADSNVTATAYTPVITVVDAQASKNALCTSCHYNRDKALVLEFYSSGHGKNGHGPTCTSCHSATTGTAHSGVDNKFVGCIGCHNGNYSRNFGSPAVQHFTNATSATFHNVSAAYVGYKGKGIQVCSACHFNVDPHGIGAANETTFEQNKEVLAAWAESAHGERSGLAWIPGASHDWRNAGSTVDFTKSIPANDCLRCHTTAGYNNFATSGYKSVAAVGAADGQRWNSPLACAACHATDARGITTAARIPAAAVSTFYNISVNKAPGVKTHLNVTFPDAGDSNICISCHAGRVSGQALVNVYNAGLNMANSGFQNSHYMAAAGMMYVKAGFSAFTTANSLVKGTVVTVNAIPGSYGTSLTSNADYTVDGNGNVALGGVSSTHRKLGTPDIIGDHGITAADGLSTGGPCVACHMGYNRNTAKGHSLAIDADAFTKVCVKCHTKEGSTTGPKTIANIDDFNNYFLAPNREAFELTLGVAKSVLLSKYGIKYDSSAYPYFYDMTKDATGKTAVTDWTRSGALSRAAALKLEGACFNINLVSREEAAYVHARTYTRRLLYDTIDWLDNNTLDLSAGATAIATDPTNFSKGATAYTDSTLGTITSGTSEGMLYIAGWDRKTGKWTTIERP